MHRKRGFVWCAALSVVLVGCAQTDSADEEAMEVEPIVLGPADGHDLPATDLDRVSAGDMAPDFSAMALSGDPITLSSFRGEKNVVLFFYRGHW